MYVIYICTRWVNFPRFNINEIRQLIMEKKKVLNICEPSEFLKGKGKAEKNMCVLLGNRPNCNIRATNYEINIIIYLYATISDELFFAGFNEFDCFVEF